jgi:glycosyltransferase involved in cell wall biosynthesis
MCTLEKIKITIITPVYNRAELLNRMAMHLSKIDYKGYYVHWLIVDDGSDEKLSLNFSFPDNILVEIIRQENSGKHVAINNSLSYIKGEFSIIVDSDDYINQRQMDNIICTIEKYGEYYPCFIAYNENTLGIRLGDLSGYFPNIIKDDIFKIKGDYSRLIRSNIISKYRFDNYDGEKFNTEINLWSKIHAEFDFKIIDNSFVTIEYQPNGLSSKYRELIRNNPKGTLSTINTINNLGYDSLMAYKFICYHLSHLPCNEFCKRNLSEFGFFRKEIIFLTAKVLKFFYGRV